jgi:hypothetical protein
MPTALTEIPAPVAPPDPPRKRWTRAECATLEAAGFLDYEDLELVEGELISEMEKKRPHVNSFSLLQEWFVHVFGWRLVNVEVPIDVAPRIIPLTSRCPISSFCGRIRRISRRTRDRKICIWSWISPIRALASILELRRRSMREPV